MASSPGSGLFRLTLISLFSFLPFPGKVKTPIKLSITFTYVPAYLLGIIKNICVLAFFYNYQVDVTHVSREIDKGRFLYLCKLSVRQPRLRKVLHGHATSYPVIEQFEQQLSKPFYFRQWNHGPVLDVLFPKATESPRVAALKKGNILTRPCIIIWKALLKNASNGKIQKPKGFHV